MTELRLATNALLGSRTNMIEIWYDGKLVGGVYPSSNGAGVDITTKHGLVVRQPVIEGALATVAVRIMVK